MLQVARSFLRPEGGGGRGRGEGQRGKYRCPFQVVRPRASFAQKGWNDRSKQERGSPIGKKSRPPSYLGP